MSCPHCGSHNLHKADCPMGVVCGGCGRGADSPHREDCPYKDAQSELVPAGNQSKALAVVTGETMQPDRAQAYVEANVDRMPRKFVMAISYGRLFHGMHRAAAESQIMDAIMKLLSYNYHVAIEKDDPMMRLVLKCTKQWQGGEEIAGPTMGKIIG